ncbi:MAG: hypothetical protein ACYCYF_08485 [Anaerolineae bacterium]
MRELGLYVSANAEMDPECELLGQMLAQLTPSVRWTIKRTPSTHEKSDPDWGALAQADFYVILVGRDITAPVGVEWRAARERHIPYYAYRSLQATPSPALSAFVRHADIEWRGYDHPQAFAMDLKQRLARQLIDGTPGYGLSMDEIEDLAVVLRDTNIEDSGSGEERRGAGRGGVILPNTFARGTT